MYYIVAEKYGLIPIYLGSNTNTRCPRINKQPNSPGPYVLWWILLLPQGLLLELDESIYILYLVHNQECNRWQQYCGIYQKGNEWINHRQFPTAPPPCIMHLPRVWHKLEPSRSLHTGRLITRIACLVVGQQRSTLAFRSVQGAGLASACMLPCPDGPVLPSLMWALEVTNLPLFLFSLTPHSPL